MKYAGPHSVQQRAIDRRCRLLGSVVGRPRAKRLRSGPGTSGSVELPSNDVTIDRPSRSLGPRPAAVGGLATCWQAAASGLGRKAKAESLINQIGGVENRE